MAICFWPDIQQVAAGFSSSPAPIAYDSQWTIAYVTPNGPTMKWVTLPSAANVGDIVEAHGQGAVVQDQNGADVGVTPCFCRKITSSLWSAVA